MNHRAFLPIIGLTVSWMSTQAAEPEAVSPLLVTEWGQTTPYNDLCPEYADGRRCKTSCVATAMAQIMRYHSYPTRGIGQKSMQWHYGDRSATLTADFGATEYQWGMMLDSYAGSYTPDQAAAVATVMYQSGIACDAEYTPDSGAFIDDAYQAMTTYFGYSTQSVLADRDDFDDDTWSELLRLTLSAGIPVYYGGYTASYLGHAFILDGYDAAGKFHVNWGFGSGGGYYPINALGSYVYGQSAMIFYPSERPGQLPAWMACTAGISAPDENVERTENAILFIKTGIKNFTGQAPEVTFALRLTHTGSSESEYITIGRQQLPDNRYVSLPELSIPLASLPAEGNYAAEIVYRQADGDWLDLQPMRKDAQMSIHLSLTPERVTAGTSSLSPLTADGATSSFSVSGNVVSMSDGYDGTVEIFSAEGYLRGRLDRRNPHSSPLPHGIYIVSARGESSKLCL